MMKRIYALVALLLIGIALHWKISSAGTLSKASPFRQQEQPAFEEPVEAKGASVSSHAKERIRSLEAEIRTRDNLIKTLLINTAAAEAPSAKPSEVRARAVEQAAQTLDQRLFLDRDENQAAELRREVERVTGDLPQGVRTEVACGGSLCRVTVHAQPEDVGEATTQLGMNVPKTFAGTLVLATADGERRLYAARDPQLLLTHEEVETRPSRP